MPEPTPTDPVLAKRARFVKLVSAGKRIGYSLFLLAVIAFFYGVATKFTESIVTIVTASLVVGSIILAPAIVFGYGIKAAEREERGLSSGH